MTIDWSKAPERARFAAMDHDGAWMFFSEKPTVEEGRLRTWGRCKLITLTISRDEVKASITQRPTE